MQIARGRLDLRSSAVSGYVIGGWVKGGRGRGSVGSGGVAAAIPPFGRPVTGYLLGAARVFFVCFFFFPFLFLFQDNLHVDPNPQMAVSRRSRYDREARRDQSVTAVCETPNPFFLCCFLSAALPLGQYEQPVSPCSGPPTCDVGHGSYNVRCTIRRHA